MNYQKIKDIDCMIYYSHYQSAKDEIQRLETQFQNNSHSEEILKFNTDRFGHFGYQFGRK